GFVGDFEEPSVFQRVDRLDQFNYFQAVLTRSIGELIQGSLEYSSIDEDDFVRGALKLDLSEWTSLLDALVLEDMTSIDRSDALNVFAAKLQSRFRIVGEQDLKLDASYTHRTEGIEFPLGDKVF